MLISRGDMKASPTTIAATARLIHARGLSLKFETSGAKIIPITVYSLPIGCMVTKRTAPMVSAQGASPRLEIILPTSLSPSPLLNSRNDEMEASVRKHGESQQRETYAGSGNPHITFKRYANASPEEDRTQYPHDLWVSIRVEPNFFKPNRINEYRG